MVLVPVILKSITIFFNVVRVYKQVNRQRCSINGVELSCEVRDTIWSYSLGTFLKETCRVVKSRWLVAKNTPYFVILAGYVLWLGVLYKRCFVKKMAAYSTSSAIYSKTF